MGWRDIQRVAAGVVVVALTALTSGCKGDSPTAPAPTTGSIRVAITTTGTDLDPDGFQFAVDGGTAQSIGVNATTTVASVSAGNRTVTLSGLAANCSVVGTNPRSVTVTAGATVDAAFAVACTSLQGYIDVAVNATGANVPTTFEAMIDGTVVGAVATGSSFLFGPYAVGNHTVELTLTANCTLASGTNPRTVAVPTGATEQTVLTTFDLTCTSTQGYIDVAVNATGANIPTTFEAMIDGTVVGAVATGSSFLFGPYAVGNHTVELTLTANCTLASGTNPRTVAVPTGATEQTVLTTFDLTCTSTQGYIDVAVNATGANIPTTFEAVIDGTVVGAVATGSSFLFGPYAVGNHTVEFTLTANCTLASGTNPRTVAVPTGATEQTVLTTFDLSCTSTQGYIDVAVNATGANIPTTFEAMIDGTVVGAVATGSSFLFGPYAVGNHTVELTLTANCTLASGTNPRTVAVPTGATEQTVLTTFDLTCTSTQGYIDVAVNATGANVPTTFEAVIDGVVVGAVATGSSFLFGPYAVGNHTVELTLTANCTLASGTNPRTVAVPTGATEQTVLTTFDLTCTSTQGYIDVAVNATGANIPTTFEAVIDGTVVGAVATGSSFLFGPYAVGNHTVELTLTANCTLASGTNPRTVAVPTGATEQTALTTFELLCN